MPIKLTLEVKDTYWGQIKTARPYNHRVALKTIHMKAGTRSSLEFHLQKHEIYLISAGALRLEVRDGRERGKTTFYDLNEGDLFYLEPGDMHARHADIDCTIIEACAYDYDYDSIIVEDARLPDAAT